MEVENIGTRELVSRRTKIGCYEVSLHVGSESHALEWEEWDAAIYWLVLSGHSPHIDTIILVLV